MYYDFTFVIFISRNTLWCQVLYRQWNDFQQTWVSLILGLKWQGPEPTCFLVLKMKATFSDIPTAFLFLSHCVLLFVLFCFVLFSFCLDLAVKKIHFLRINMETTSLRAFQRGLAFPWWHWGVFLSGLSFCTGRCWRVPACWWWPIGSRCSILALWRRGLRCGGIGSVPIWWIQAQLRLCVLFFFFPASSFSSET